jgi:hypothetical protein
MSLACPRFGAGFFRHNPGPTMQSTFISMAVVALLGIAPLSAQAAKPCETLSEGAAALDERQSARPEAQAYAETNKLRYAAYYEDAKERCTVYDGQARNICIGEGRMKYVQ